jgi:hypothetical protein
VSVGLRTPPERAAVIQFMLQHRKQVCEGSAWGPKASSHNTFRHHAPLAATASSRMVLGRRV